jgi:hypothetical protein
MALRDKIVLTLTNPKQKIEVVATSPGGQVVFETFTDTHVKVAEVTRKGKEKRAVVVARTDLRLLEVINA